MWLTHTLPLLSVCSIWVSGYDLLSAPVQSSTTDGCFQYSQPDSQTNITSENAHGNDAWMDRNPAADGFFVLLQQHITHTRWGKGLWGPRASMDIDCFPKALPRPWTLHPGRKGWSNPHTTRRGRAALARHCRESWRLLFEFWATAMQSWMKTTSKLTL